MDGAVDSERIAAVIRSTKAGLIGLQELDRGWARSGGADQPAALAEHLGMNVFFRPTVVRGDARYGIGVACAEGLHTELVPLPGRSGGEPRSAVVTHWEGVTFIVTHLSRNAASRAQQTAALADLCRAQKGPVVLMGDLNQTTRHLGPFRDAGLRGPRRGTATAPSRFPYRQIDHILAGGGARVVRSWTIRTRASDHLPLVAEIEVGVAGAR
jgi:endonuclease/exonuclease/phosphatase family metal-dependent hydrolase